MYFSVSRWRLLKSRFKQNSNWKMRRFEHLLPANLTRIQLTDDRTRLAKNIAVAEKQKRVVQLTKRSGLVISALKRQVRSSSRSVCNRKWCQAYLRHILHFVDFIRCLICDQCHLLSLLLRPFDNTRSTRSTSITIFNQRHFIFSFCFASIFRIKQYATRFVVITLATLTKSRSQLIDLN